MYTEIKHYPVNWIDGMRIGKSHFEDSNSFILDHVRDAIGLSLNQLNFGLLHSENHKEHPSLKWSIQFSNNAFIEIHVEHCKATCPDGTRIDIQPVHKCISKTSFQALASTLNLNLSIDNYFYVVVQTNSINRRPYGAPIPEEVPPRHPYTMPSYQLSIVPIQQYHPEIGYASQIPIGKIGYINGHLIQIPGFIPPAMTIGAHPLLLDHLHQIREILSRMELSAYKVIQRAFDKGTSQSVIAKNVAAYSQSYIHLFTQNTLYFQWMAGSLPPVYLAESMGKIWLALRAFIEMLSIREREEVMAYLSEWMNITQGDLEQRMFFYRQADYNHNDLGSLFVQMVDNLKFFEEMFSRLSQLEFIGKRRGQSLLINEKSPEPERVARKEGPGKFSSLME